MGHERRPSVVVPAPDSGDDHLAFREHGAAVSFRVHVTPRSSRTALLGVRAGVLCVALAAPPVEGEANAALVEFLARKLSVRKRAVRVIRGERSRHKTVCVEGVSAEQVRAAVEP